MTISLDPNVRPAIVAGPDGDLTPARERIERLVRLAHVVKASDEDLGHLYPGVPVDDAARAWLDLGPSLVVVTLGAEGALALTPTGSLTVKAPAVQVADTVGAGDTFAGALLYGLDTAGALGTPAPGPEAAHSEQAAPGEQAPGGPAAPGEQASDGPAAAIAELDAGTLRQIVVQAAAAAALNCTRPGANPPTTAELADFLTTQNGM